jgi:hypothetical protein
MRLEQEPSRWACTFADYVGLLARVIYTLLTGLAKFFLPLLRIPTVLSSDSAMVYSLIVQRSKLACEAYFILLHARWRESLLSVYPAGSDLGT